MDRTWYLVNQEISPLAQNVQMYTHGFIEFVSREEMEASVLVPRIRETIDRGFLILGAALYQDVPTGETNRWYAEISLAPREAVDMPTFQAQVESLGQDLATEGLVYRATKEWPWDWASGVISDIGQIMQMVMMLMVMGLMMFMMVPLLSAG
ncbi:MAG: hypothetical protein JW753_05310 [Dehalococcoidia bacterium]|nr:hypothetical protein [Dehalococcoidia bacterium]